MDKRGISAVVATVLIILITVASVTIIWAAIIPMINDQLDFSALESRVDIVTSEGYTFYDSASKKASVQVRREPDDGVIEEVNIVFSVDGNSFEIPVAAPASGNEKVYVFDLSAYGEPDSVSVAPIFIVGEKEKVGSVTSDVSLHSNGVLTPKANLNLVLPDSLINSDSWEVGSGSVDGYVMVGSSSENNREIGIGPYGDSVLLWKAIPDGGYGGGWNGDQIVIDHTKTYRVTIWVKSINDHDGTVRFGCGYTTLTLNLDDTPVSYPFFLNGDLPELDKWYLLVGYIHGSGDPSMVNYGGIYDGVTGEKVQPLTDFKNNDGAATQKHRAFIYDAGVGDNRYFWNPTFTEVSEYDLPLEIE